MIPDFWFLGASALNCVMTNQLFLKMSSTVTLNSYFFVSDSDLDQEAVLVRPEIDHEALLVHLNAAEVEASLAAEVAAEHPEWKDSFYRQIFHWQLVFIMLFSITWFHRWLSDDLEQIICGAN